jgi:hypothetical protein
MDKSWILSNFCHDIQKDVGHLMGKSSRWWLSPTPLKNDGLRQLGLFFPIYGKSQNSMVPNHQPVVKLIKRNGGCSHVVAFEA